MRHSSLSKVNFSDTDERSTPRRANAATFAFDDRRAVAQLHMRRQALADQSPRQIQLRSVQRMAYTVSAGVVQRQLIDNTQENRQLNARLTNEYHEAEEAGDGCSVRSRVVAVHQQAIEHYNRAKRKRRQAGRLHTTDQGHETAIGVLSDKIATRRNKIRELEPAQEQAQARAPREERRRPNWFSGEPIGTGAQASWLTGISAWPG